MKRNELLFQNHIIESYERAGGRAQKWASEWQANKPDLICSLPLIGLHLMEVKHLPEWDPAKKNTHRNVLTIGQQKECKMYLDAGASVYAGVVMKSSYARGSVMALFNPIVPEWNILGSTLSEYVLGVGFDIQYIISNSK